MTPEQIAKQIIHASAGDTKRIREAGIIIGEALRSVFLVGFREGRDAAADWHAHQAALWSGVQEGPQMKYHEESEAAIRALSPDEGKGQP